MPTTPHYPNTCAMIADGTMFDLADPHFPGWRPIAQGLARQERFAGALEKRWSHADHAMLMADLADPGCTDAQLRLTALLYDAPKFIVGELTRPAFIVGELPALKDPDQYISQGTRAIMELEGKLFGVMRRAAGLEGRETSNRIVAISIAKKQGLFLEIEQLAPDGPAKDAMRWPDDLPRPHPAPRLQPRSWDMSADMWEAAVINTISEITAARMTAA